MAAGDIANWQTWLTIVAAGVVTLLARASFIVLPPETRTPIWLQRGLKFVAAAVLPALVIPDVLFRDVPPGDVVNVYRIVAASIALLVAWRSRSVLATLGVGLGILWLLHHFRPF
jgi:branched-subunit amino acid transport protein